MRDTRPSARPQSARPGPGVYLSLVCLAGLMAGCGGSYEDSRPRPLDGSAPVPRRPPPAPPAGTPIGSGPPSSPPGGSSRGGFVVVTGDDADDLWHCERDRCGGLYPSLFRAALSRSRSGGSGILAIGVNGSQALTAFDSWNDPANGGPGARVTHLRSTEDLSRVDFDRFAFVYLPSAERHTLGGLTEKQIAGLNERQPDLARFVNERGGSLIALTQAGVAGGWGFLPIPLRTTDIDFDFAEPTAGLLEFSPSLSAFELSHKSFHNVFTGPDGFSGLRVLAYNDEVYNPHSGRPVMLGGSAVILTAEDCADGLDNDGDGAVDGQDMDCQVCGNGTVDPGEACDDGNVKDGDGCSAACHAENRAPEATCHDVSVCTDPGVCVATVTGLATATDADGDALSWDLHPSGPYAPGEYGVCVTVSDGRAHDSCWSRVEVRDCEAPTLVCPGPLVAECTGRNSAYVVPGVATASDACTRALVSGPPADFYPLGSHTVRYTARDASGNESSCTSTLEVVDQTPPVVTLSPPEPLWPADQLYRTLRLEDCIVVHDACGGGLTHTGASASLSCVSSDEPQSGSEPDIVFVDATTVKVRAARSDSGDGRVYSLRFEVRDAAGNVSHGLCPVGVPLARAGAPVLDSGEQWRSCRPAGGAPEWKPIPLAR